MGRCIGRERESVNVPENPVVCQKRETFLVLSHPPSSSFSTQLSKKMADVKKVKSPQDFMSLYLFFFCISFHLILSLVDFLMGGVSAVRILFRFSCSTLPLSPLPRPSLRRQPRPSSESSCWCKTRMRWYVTRTLPSIQLTLLPDQARSSCHAIQGYHRRFQSYLQGRGHGLVMARKYRQRDPLLPYAGFELCLQYVCSLCFLQYLILFLAEDYFKSLFGFKKSDGYWKWFGGNVASGGAAGASSLLFVYSLDYARTRLANDAKSAKGGGARQFNGLVDVYKKTLASDGIAGLYRGFVPSVVGIIVYRGLYFGVYDSLSMCLVNFWSSSTDVFLQSLLSLWVPLRDHSWRRSSLVGVLQLVLALRRIRSILSGWWFPLIFLV